MSTIANLRVKLSADATQLQKGMKKAKESMKKLGAATAVVGAGFAAIVLKGLQSADALEKMSIRTGASVEALSVLEHAASLADIEMTDLSRGLFNLNRNMAAANDGAKAPAEAFEKLGLSAEELAKKSPADAFGIIADALNGITDESQKALIGFGIFGGAFRKMSPILAGGSQGMRDAAKEAGALGIILSTDAADGAAAAIDSIAKLEGTFSGLVRSMAVNFGPDISSFLEMLGTEIPAVAAAIKAAFIGVGSVIGGVIAALVSFYSGDWAVAGNIVGSLFSGQASADVNASLGSSLASRAGAGSTASGLSFGGGKSGKELGNLQQTNDAQLNELKKITSGAFFSIPKAS